MPEPRTIAELKARTAVPTVGAAPAPVLQGNKPRISQEVLSTAAQFVEEFHAVNVRAAEQEALQQQAVTTDVAQPVQEELSSSSESPRDKQMKRYLDDLNKNLPEMDFAQLVANGRVVQDVPVVSKKVPVVVTYQSILAAEAAWIDNMYRTEEHRHQPSWPGLARLVVQVKAVNGVALPHHGDKNSAVSDALFAAKFAKVTSMAETLVTWMLTHNNWFDNRVSELFQDEFETIKNG